MGPAKPDWVDRTEKEDDGVADSAGPRELQVDPGGLLAQFFERLVHDFTSLLYATATLRATTGPEAEVPEIVDALLDRLANR